MSFKHLTIYSAAVCVAATAFGQKTPDRPPSDDNSVEAELASLTIHPDFEVSLFADEKLGISNPIAIQWDHRGRAWVLCTLAYSQLKPAEIANDKLFILEDTDGDGRADKSTVFADGLDMPMGFALGHGGVYLGEGPDLVHLKDVDGDDKYDSKELILTGFGTGDTHQNISNFTFDSGGFLYFSQGLHCYSHVETPWGVVHGDKAGFWRFDPRITKLDPFCFPSMMSQNPCGIALDRWGALFVKSNGVHFGFATPGLIPTTHPRELMQHALIGATPGKSMGAEIIETAHMPDWAQNNAIISGYFARKLSLLPLVDEGAGFKKVEPTILISADHESFRPVDSKIGPDGAIYVVDWFNPIINHYQVSLRHPHRDYDHGRIWRVVAKDRKLVKAPEISDEKPTELFELLGSDERWVRDQARRLLMEADLSIFRDELVAWIGKLDPKSPGDSHLMVEAVGILESHRVVLPELLDLLQASEVPQARALVARMIARSADEIADADERLASLLKDPHPRPRLEAVVACANRPRADSLKLALTALDSEVDKNIDYSLTQTVHALSDQWMPALESGELVFENPQHLAFALETYGGDSGVGVVRKALLSENLSGEKRAALLGVLASIGNPNDLKQILDRPHEDAALLNNLVDSWPKRRVRPAAPFAPRLEELIDSENTAVAAAAIRLAGLWKAKELSGKVKAIALDSKRTTGLRLPAIMSLAALQGKGAVADLKQVAIAGESAGPLQKAAIEGLAVADVQSAVDVAVQLIGVAPAGTELMPLLNPILSKKTGPPLLTNALADVELSQESARQIANALVRLGRSDLKLTAILAKTLGVQPGAPEYDAEKVKSIVAAVESGDGNAEKGKVIYARAELTCIACHQIGKAGGLIGPELDAVGAGLPLDQIVESVIWPARQLKEGYFATSITTVDEQVHTGYIDRETGGEVWIKDTVTQKVRPVSLHQVVKREQVGTLMPPGLTNSLKPEELVDLIAYLASLKG